MPNGTVTEIMPATRVDVFRVLHDYDQRLQWDTLLQAAYLTDGTQTVDRGVVAVCKGRRHLGGITLRSKYVTFRSPRIAAVKMVNRPPFFDHFAATIRHRDISESSSVVEYKYHFTARPKWLRIILHPIMNRVFAWETKKRLRSLKAFLQVQSKVIN